MIRVMGLGDNVVDHYLHTNTIYPGGNAMNFAVYASLAGYPAAYLGVFGDDAAAFHVYQTARELAIDLSHCRFYRGENGRARVTLENGDRRFLPGNKGGISREIPIALSKLDIAYIAQHDLVHSSCFSYMEEELPRLKEAGVRVSFDFSDVFTDEYLEKVCPHIWCACLSSSERSDEENRALMERIAGMGCLVVILTRGSRGALVLVEGGLYEQAPCLVEAKDTMGAGDSFITAFLLHYVEGVGDARNFPREAGERGIVTEAVYKRELIRTSLYRAAVFSAQTCLRDGAFGYGKCLDEA